jgi:hypothetical protein
MCRKDHHRSQTRNMKEADSHEDHLLGEARPCGPQFQSSRRWTAIVKLNGGEFQGVALGDISRCPTALVGNRADGLGLRSRTAALTEYTGLVALVLSDTEEVWITFIRGRYQQTSRVGSGDCSQIVATEF